MIVSGGAVVTPGGIVRADVFVEDGVVAALARALPRESGTEVIDATGCVVLPGVIDAHSHLWEAGFASGPNFADSTASAAAGGVTTVIDMPLTTPEVLDRATFRDKVRLGEKTSHVDFALHGGVCPDNLGALEGMWRAGATALKIFTCETGCAMAGVIDDGDLRDALETIAGFGGLATFHAENDALLRRNLHRLAASGRTDDATFCEYRDELVELEAIGRIVLIAEFTRARVNAEFTRARVNIVHVTSARAVETALAARARGVEVFVETCPHYLYLTAEDVAERGAWATCAPPVRRRDKLEALRRMVADGLVRTIGSDHGPIDPELKRRGEGHVLQAQPGLPGNETMVPLLLNLVAEGVLTLEQVAELVAEAPARLYGLYPRKGAVAVGSDGDFTIVDPGERWTIRGADLVGRAGWTPYEGMEVQGRVRFTVVRGRVVAENGRVRGEPGRARFLPRQGADQVP